MYSLFSSPRSAWKISYHAAKRMNERDINEQDIDFIIRQGEATRVEEDRMLFTIPGSPFAVLDPSGRRKRVNGSSVVLSSDGVIVTVYRNDDRCPYHNGGQR